MSRKQVLLEFCLKFCEQILRDAWCKETCSPAFRDQWSEKNPALGQCAVTALLVQDLFGGNILRYTIAGYGSHYCNLIDDMKIDFTGSQFPHGTTLHPAMIPGDFRKYLLYSQNAKEAQTEERYTILVDRCAAAAADLLYLLKTVKDSENIHL